MVNRFSKHEKLIYCLLVINVYVINLKVNNPMGNFSYVKIIPLTVTTFWEEAKVLESVNLFCVTLDALHECY
jgi:hypothetical protein